MDQELYCIQQANNFACTRRVCGQLAHMQQWAAGRRHGRQLQSIKSIEAYLPEEQLGWVLA